MPSHGRGSPQCARVLTGQGHQELALPDMGLDEILNRLHCGSVDTALQIESSRRRDPAPLTVGFASQCFVVELDLLGGFDDRGRTVIGTEDVARGMLVRRGKNIDACLVRMAPGLIDPKKIIVEPEPACRDRHRDLWVNRGAGRSSAGFRSG